MKRFWPLFLVAVGFLIFVGGFAYDLAYAGIPYPDPTPEMSARYDFHETIASCFYGAGAFLFFIGIFAGIAKSLRRFARRTHI